MADMTDAGDALVTLIAGIVYPGGATVASVTGDRVLIYQGSPDPVVLAGDLAAGVIHVSVFPRPGDTVTSISPGDDDDSDEDDGGGSAVVELRRQSRLFQIEIWAGAHARRDATAGVIDAGLAAVSRLVLVDGSTAVMSYDGSSQHDEQQQAGIYRRELLYAVNYATTQVQVLTAISATVSDVTPVVNGADLATVSIVS